MIDLECPSCGRVGSVPRDKASTRLICRKCHTVFHMGATGRAVLGEPPTAKSADHAAPAQRRPRGDEAAAPILDVLAGITAGGVGELNRGLIGVLAVLLLVGGVAAVVMTGGFGSSGRTALTPQSQALAAALDAGDAGAVRALATADTVDEAGTWFEAANRTLQGLKNGTATHKVSIQSIVMEENQGTGFGQATMFLVPDRGVERNEQITRSAGTAPERSTEVSTFWKFVGGRWRLDGAKTLQDGQARSR